MNLNEKTAQEKKGAERTVMAKGYGVRGWPIFVSELCWMR